MGVQRGDVLLVHASLRALGPVPGGAATVIAGLRAALGADGALLMPALSYAAVTPGHPHFDLALTPSNVGVIAETFRRQPGVLRSLHPTHSVCGQGAAAEMLLASHAVDHTPCGPHSPFHCLPQHHGKILMLGCGLRPNTSFHAIEELVEPPYLFGAPIDYTLVDGDGRRIVKRYITHNFAGVHQRYDRIGLLLQAPDLRVGRVLGATVHLLDAAAMWQAALSALQREALAFVEPAAPGAA
ncbi:MAG: AAC(3) family N-acetyltransferase [Caldilineaceae bacterium]|nr:AAC(3) family N-acetyltransferase [Caldilineaceae bacterium]